MGSEGELGIANGTPKLPLYSIPPPMASPEPSGTLTPPVHAIAAVPFRWEEEPGKPRPSTALTLFTGAAAKCLDLPPRLLLPPHQLKAPKMPSPTTVLDGPYHHPSSAPGSLSFRRSSPERGRGRTIVLGRMGRRSGERRRGVFGIWGWRIRRRGIFGKKAKRDVSDGGSFVFSSPAGDDGGGDTAAKVSRARKKGGGFLSVSPRATSHFWATVYEGLKQVNPWRRRKSNKDGLMVMI